MPWATHIEQSTLWFSYKLSGVILMQRCKISHFHSFKNILICQSNGIFWMSVWTVFYWKNFFSHYKILTWIFENFIYLKHSIKQLASSLLIVFEKCKSLWRCASKSVFYTLSRSKWLLFQLLLNWTRLYPYLVSPRAMHSRDREIEEKIEFSLSFFNTMNSVSFPAKHVSETQQVAYHIMFLFNNARNKIPCKSIPFNGT